MKRLEKLFEEPKPEPIEEPIESTPKDDEEKDKSLGHPDPPD